MGRQKKSWLVRQRIVLGIELNINKLRAKMYRTTCTRGARKLLLVQYQYSTPVHSFFCVCVCVCVGGGDH
jgi:hypothetical protein